MLLNRKYVTTNNSSVFAHACNILLWLCGIMEMKQEDLTLLISITLHVAWESALGIVLLLKLKLKAFTKLLCYIVLQQRKVMTFRKNKIIRVDVTFIWNTIFNLFPCILKCSLQKKFYCSGELVNLSNWFGCVASCRKLIISFFNCDIVQEPRCANTRSIGRIIGSWFHYTI